MLLNVLEIKLGGGGRDLWFFLISGALLIFLKGNLIFFVMFAQNKDIYILYKLSIFSTFFVFMWYIHSLIVFRNSWRIWIRMKLKAWYSFIHSPLYLFIHSSIHWLCLAAAKEFGWGWGYSLIDPFSFIHSSFHSFIYSIIHLFVYYLFMYWLCLGAAEEFGWGWDEKFDLETYFWKGGNTRCIQGN